MCFQGILGLSLCCRFRLTDIIVLFMRRNCRYTENGIFSWNPFKQFVLSPMALIYFTTSLWLWVQKRSCVHACKEQCRLFWGKNDFQVIGFMLSGFEIMFTGHLQMHDWVCTLASSSSTSLSLFWFSCPFRIHFFNKFGYDWRCFCSWYFFCSLFLFCFHYERNRPNNSWTEKQDIFAIWRHKHAKTHVPKKVCFLKEPPQGQLYNPDLSGSISCYNSSRFVRSHIPASKMAKVRLSNSFKKKRALRASPSSFSLSYIRRRHSYTQR